MIDQQDYENLVDSSYTRKQLCWLLLSCLERITKLNKKIEDNETLQTKNEKRKKDK